MSLTAQVDYFIAGNAGHQNLSHDGIARQAATELFNQQFRKGQRAQLWNKLKKQARQLAALERVQIRATVGEMVVPLDRIVGSENRADDFDLEFYPLARHTAHRWIGVAIARLMDVPLPPVELIEVGGVYYVRDGHHRISVARALGETSIAAYVVRGV